MRALARANEIRLARSEAKRGIRGGELSIAEAMRLECCQSMTVYDLLQAQRGWGSSGLKKSEGRRATKVLSRLEISPYRRVEQLSDRQRGLLVEASVAVYPRAAA